MYLVLIHSPLLDVSTIDPLARSLTALGFEVLTPALPYEADQERSYCRPQAEAVAKKILRYERSKNPVLIGYSASGALLPLVASRLNSRVKGYLFIDADIPADGLTRLELLKIHSPEAYIALDRLLQVGGEYPNWTLDDLQEIMPNLEVRRWLLGRLRPYGLGFFSEPIPVFEGWPDASCGYLQLSAGYSESAREAERRGWPLRRMDGMHFRPITNPDEVSHEMVDLLTTMANSADRKVY